jgi:hypothetical protein
MSSMVLTPVYLEPKQKQALSSQAKKSGRKVPEIMRGIMLSQQRELAEVRGQLKALIRMQGAAAHK